MEIPADIISEGSIVVLPFRNMSSDKENEYFSDGITEEIITALTKVEGLSVIARTSAFSFKGKDIDLREVGARLNVANILEGSIRKSGNRVRVSAQLIKASNGFHVFSEVYDRELKDIFEVQDEISNKIVQKFTDVIGTQKIEKRLIPSATKDIDAYELYLKGRYNLSKSSLEATKTAIAYFETALKKDSKFTLPLTGLSACYTFLGGSGLMPSNESFSRAKDYAERAISLDSNIAENHLALANSYFWHDWDFENTRLSINTAIRLSPGTASIHGFNSVYLMASGKIEEAMIEAHLAAKLDPLSLKGKFRIAELYFRSERFIEAIELFEEILSENPYFNLASILKAWSHLLLGETELAVSIFSRLPVTSDQTITFYGGLAYAYYKLKQFDKVLDCMKNFKTELANKNSHWLNYNYILLFRALGEKEKMFEHLEICLEEKDTPLLFIKVDPVWKEYRNDPRFIDILEQTFVSEKRKKIVLLKSDTRETLELNLKNLVYIEAQENYSRIVWSENNSLKEKLLRATLGNIEEQISDSYILRCHRSFIINTNFKFIISGNSNGYNLKSKHFKESIPISRSLGKEIVTILRKR